MSKRKTAEQYSRDIPDSVMGEEEVDHASWQERILAEAKANRELMGQVAIVTGGGRGVGRGIARVMAAAGAVVAVAARSEDQLTETVDIVKSRGDHAVAVVTDVTDQRDVERMVRNVERGLGPVDVLVNNAGRHRAIGPSWEVDPENWWREFEVNLRGPYLCARAVLPGMIGRRRGKIINMASRAAMRPTKYYSAYGVSKTALVRFSEVLASEAEQHGIKVYAIGPGFVRTSMTEHGARSAAGQEWMPQVRDSLQAGVDSPPERAGQLAVLLASSAGDGLSGRFIRVQDDPQALVHRAEEVQRDDLYVLRVGQSPHVNTTEF